GQLERQAPELLGSQDTRDRLAVDAAREELFEPCRFTLVQCPSGGCDQPGEVEIKRSAHQKPRGELGRIGPCGGKAGGERAPGGLDGCALKFFGGHAAAPCAASCAA